jgi:hypothetical protein
LNQQKEQIKIAIQVIDAQIKVLEDEIKDMGITPYQFSAIGYQRITKRINELRKDRSVLLKEAKKIN